jgi:hypothetical protein
MAQLIKFKRGALANLPALEIGEPAFTTDTFDMYVGSSDGNKKVSRNADTLAGNNAAYYLSRDNHTGTQLAATISDFDTSAVDAVVATLDVGTNLVDGDIQFQYNAGDLSALIKDGAVALSNLESGLVVTSLAVSNNTTIPTVKAVVDAINLVQTELDNVETGLGFNADGTKPDFTSTNNILAADSVVAAINKLDTAIGSSTTNLGDIQTELDATQVGAGLDTDGDYTAYAQYDVDTEPTGAHYIHTATSLKAADKILDGALKAEEAARIAADGTLSGRLDDVEGDIVDIQGDLNFQSIYDNSTAVGGQVVVTLAEDKALKFLDNNDNTYFMLDPDGSNPINVSMTGPVSISGDMTISGDLTVTGQTTTVNSEVTNSDHLALLPAGGEAALVIHPTANFTGENVVDIKAQNGGASVLKIDKTTASVDVTKLNASGAVVLNGTVNVNNTFTVGAATTISMGNNVVGGVANGTANDHAVNKSQLDTVASDASGALSTAVSTLNGTINDLQGELDDTQAGAGLGTDGAYTAFAQYHVDNEPAGAHYIHTATTLNSADKILDGALKTESNARIAADSALDGRVTTLETANNNNTANVQGIVADMLDDSASVSFVYDDVTKTFVANVNADGITNTMINSNVAGAGLGQDANGALEVNAGHGIEVASDLVTIKLDGTSLSKSADGLKVNTIDGGTF